MRTRLGFLLLVSISAPLAGAAIYRFWPDEPLPRGAKADLIVVDKSDRTLSLVSAGQIIKTYRVALGRHPQGAKAQKDDGRTPEGRYVIDSRNRDSGFYRALHISYPNAADSQRARARGAEPGGDIMIHGIKNGFGWLGKLHRLVDWTDGCVAVTDQEMLEIWTATSPHIPVELRP